MRRRRALALVSAAALAVAVPTFASQAATPSPQTVTVSNSPGQNDSVAWSGTITGPSSHPTSTCNNGAPDPTVDVETIHVNAPAGVYDSVTATFTFSITWKPNVDGTTSDEILTVVDPNGNEVGSSDGGSNTETVTATNLQPGDYMVEACGFVNATPQAYDGKLTLTTVARNSTPSLPSGPANGLAFSASVASDPQRDEAEPLIETAPDGKTYTCGPTGFTSASDYAQVSTDGGNQFHLIGTPPRGQQALGGGGDCAINLAPDKNPVTNEYNYAYAGLGPLTGFATSTSPDAGHTLVTAGPAGNGTQSTGVLADRQWNVFTDATTAFLSYNQQVPRNIVVQRSDDAGLTYGPITAVGGAAPDFPGPMRTLPGSLNKVNPGQRIIYFGWSQGTHANLSVSYDDGATFMNCVAAVESGQPRAGFVTVDNDVKGNIYLAYADKAQFHSYLVTLPIGKLGMCNQPVTKGNTNLATDAVSPKNDPQAIGWSTPLQVDRNKIRTTVFPWVAAGGAPGRVAVTFYGTETEGNPDFGPPKFKASWNVYVNQSTNALATTGRTFSQVRATTHPMHYDSICLGGLGCTVTGGDRSLADFFAIKTNPATGRLQVVYDNDNKQPDEASGHVASPMVFTQIGGPNTKGGTVSGGNSPVVRPASADPMGDAIANYSGLIAPPAPAMTNEPAADLRLLNIGAPTRSGGGFDVSMTLASLSTTDVAKALADTKSQSLIYALRFSNGYQVSAVTARTTDGINFTYKFNDYDTLLTECNAAPQTGDDKCLSFGQTGKPIKGSVSGNTITMTVPLKYSGGGALLKKLTGSQGDQQRPHEALATSGSRFFDATAFTFADVFPTESGVLPQTYLSTLDNTPAMDFVLP